MPNQRANGQVLIGCHVDAAFAAAIDRARKGKSRSDFLREALFSYLAACGVEIPEVLKYAPDRTGKGGRKKKTATSSAALGRGADERAQKKRA